MSDPVPELAEGINFMDIIKFLIMKLMQKSYIVGEEGNFTKAREGVEKKLNHKGTQRVSQRRTKGRNI